MPLKGDGRHLFFAEEQAPLKLPRTGSSDLRISNNSPKLGYPKPRCIAIFLKKSHFVDFCGSFILAFKSHTKETPGVIPYDIRLFG